MKHLECQTKEFDVILYAGGYWHRCYPPSSEHRVNTPAEVQTNLLGSDKNIKISSFCPKMKKLNFINI